MSFDYVKRVSIRNHTMELAANNLRPLLYETCKFTPKSDREFIVMILINTLDGNFHFVNDNNDFSRAIYLLKSDNEKQQQLEDIENKRWHNYDFSTKAKRFTEEEVNKANNDLENMLYEYYLEVKDNKKDYQKTCYIALDNFRYLIKNNRYSVRYTYNIENAKKYDNYINALIDLDSLKYSSNFNGAKIVYEN